MHCGFQAIYHLKDGKLGCILSASGFPSIWGEKWAPLYSNVAIWQNRLFPHKKIHEFRETSYFDLLGSWIKICRRSFKHLKKASKRGFQASCWNYETRSCFVKGDILRVCAGGPGKIRGCQGTTALMGGGGEAMCADAFSCTNRLLALQQGFQWSRAVPLKPFFFFLCPKPLADRKYL